MRKVKQGSEILWLAGLGESSMLQSTGFPRGWLQRQSRGAANVRTVDLIRPTKPKNPFVTFKPSPASLLCAGMSFSVSMFYHDASVSPSVMASALRQLANEAPILAGRIFPETSRIFPRFSDHAIRADERGRDGGFSFRSETRSDNTLRQAIDAIWKNRTPLLLHERRPTSHAIEPLTVGKTNTDELAHVDLVNYGDGAVLTLHVSHLLADAGRAMRLLERLSVIYESIGRNQAIPRENITCDTWFDSVARAAEQEDRGREQERCPIELLRVHPSHLFKAPAALRYYASTKFEPIYIYVPREAVTAVQVAETRAWARAAKEPPAEGAADGDTDGDTRPVTITRHDQPGYLSKMDILQALVVTLMRRARPDMDGEANVVINMDLSKLYPADTRDILGNSSDFLQVRDIFHPTDIIHNARIIRSAIDRFRSNAPHNVRLALRNTTAMSTLPTHAVHAAFILHGSREKLASCTAVASFPVDAIRFGGKAPSFHWVNSHIGFDWWSIISSVEPGPLTEMDGYVVSMNVPEGVKFRCLFSDARNRSLFDQIRML